MKTTTTLTAIIGVMTLVGCRSADLTVSVSCSEPSMRFAGTIVSDGRTQELSGTGSGTYHTNGHEIVCSFKKLDADGRISLAVSKSGTKLGDSSTPEKFGGVRAELHRTWMAQSAVFTAFRTETAP